MKNQRNIIGKFPLVITWVFWFFFYIFLKVMSELIFHISSFKKKKNSPWYVMKKRHEIVNDSLQTLANTMKAEVLKLLN